MRLPRPVRSAPRVPLSPLIDIVFILLIFVLLVARFSEDEQVDVRPPVSTTGRDSTRSDDTLVVHLDRDGQLSVAGAAVAPERLEAVLRSARLEHAALLLRGDGQVPLQGAVDVLSAASKAGFDEVGVVTRPPEAGARQ